MEKESKQKLSKYQWHGRIDDIDDPETDRIHQVIQHVEQEDLEHLSSGYTIIGYACDEGVRRNKGRVGATDGPDTIRKALSNMAYHGSQAIYDLGNCTCRDDHMEIAQANYASKVRQALEAHHKVVGIGGGHDIAYASGTGVYQYLKDQKSKSKLGIINIDTHLDLRKPKNEGTSGTPFYQLAEDLADDFNYLAIGIQSYANTSRLFTTADDFNTTIIYRHELFDFDKAKKRIQEFISVMDHIYLTIDLDGMDAATCPGVSAPSVNGMTLREVTNIVHILLASNKLILLDIAEMNPWYDKDNRTAKVAAYLIHLWLSSQNQ